MSDSQDPSGAELYQTPGGTAKISDALKERLRKSGRSHFRSPAKPECAASSPILPALPSVDPLLLSGSAHPSSPATPCAAAVHPSNGIDCSPGTGVTRGTLSTPRLIGSRRFHPFRSPALGLLTKGKAVNTKKSLELVHDDDSGGSRGAAHCSDDLSPESDDVVKLLEEKKKLLIVIAQQKDRLRKLNLVQLYRKKNDLASLQELTSKWLSAAQRLLLDLRDAMSSGAVSGGSGPTLLQLMSHYQIDPSLIKYDAENDGFAG